MDVVSPAERSRIMRTVRSSGNLSTEGAFKTLLKKEGITGWRRSIPLPGKPDFVFPASKLAVFVDGCFWHGCSLHLRLPKENRAYWKLKVDTNRNRDRANVRNLRALGWKTLRVWEHSFRTPASLALTVKRLRKAIETNASLPLSSENASAPSQHPRPATKDLRPVPSSSAKRSAWEPGRDTREVDFFQSKNRVSEEEQDRAAGGKELRIVHLPSGRTATGSVQLSWQKGGQYFLAVFRFRTWGGTQTVNLGHIPISDRAVCLKKAWGLVHARGLQRGGGLLEQE